jgi:MFS family permease
MFINQGALSTFNVFVPKLAEALGCSVTYIALSASFTNGAAALTGLTFGPQLVKKIGPKRMLYIVSVLLLMHYLGFAWAPTPEIFFCFGAMAGPATALGTAGVVGVIVADWFIEKRATVVGFMLGCALFGVTLWVKLVGGLIEAYGYKAAYVILGTILCIAGISVNRIFLRNTKDLGQKPLGWEKQEQLVAAAARQNLNLKGTLLKEAARSPAFYLSIIGLFCATFAIATKNYRTALLVESGLPYGTAVNQISIISLFAAISAIIGGAFATKFGAKLYITVIWGVLAIGSGIVGFTGGIAAAGVFVFAFCLCAFCDSAVHATSNIQTTSAFGDADFARIDVFVNSGNYAGGTIAGFLYNAITGSGKTLFDCYKVGSIVAIAGIACMVLAQVISPYARSKKAVAG